PVGGEHVVGEHHGRHRVLGVDAALTQVGPAGPVAGVGAVAAQRGPQLLEPGQRPDRQARHRDANQRSGGGEVGGPGRGEVEEGASKSSRSNAGAGVIHVGSSPGMGDGSGVLRAGSAASPWANGASARQAGAWSESRRRPGRARSAASTAAVAMKWAGVRAGHWWGPVPNARWARAPERWMGPGAGATAGSVLAPR